VTQKKKSSNQIFVIFYIKKSFSKKKKNTLYSLFILFHFNARIQDIKKKRRNQKIIQMKEIYYLINIHKMRNNSFQNRFLDISDIFKKNITNN
jgi:hypothetical protein